MEEKFRGQEFSKKSNLQEREYTIGVKVFVGRKYLKQGTKGEATEFQYTCLVPKDSTEATRFYNAWLPDDENALECIVEMGHPVYGLARCAVSRASGNYPEGPHLFVMSKSVEDILIKKSGESMVIKTLRGSEDSEDSHALDDDDTNISIDKI